MFTHRDVISTIIAGCVLVFFPSLAKGDHLTRSNYPEPTTKHVIPAQLERERPPIETGWGLSLRGGTSFFSDDLDRSVNFVINGQLFYNTGGANSDGPWNMGVNFDWERHANLLKNTDANLETISLIPFIEFQKKYDIWSPYVTLGAGVNINSITNEPSGSMNLGAKDTFAFRGGLGTDVYLTKSLAFNAESVWKSNNSGGLDASVVQVLFGFRWYFGR